MQAALIFSSTFAANIGLVAALGVSGSLILSDAANHASLVDGARLARAEVHVFPHLDLAAVERTLRANRSASACWVVTEAYFSMDGDGPDLNALHELCKAEDACLIIDEAHSLGVFGDHGAGRCAEFGVEADVLTGALGKAVGSHGGFVAGSAELRTYLWNKARSFMYSTAPSPQHTAVTLAQVRAARAADAARAQLQSSAARVRARLEEAGLPLVRGSFGPVVSLIVGENERALAVARRVRSHGILVQAVRPPTVPAGESRLRLTIKANFDEVDVDRLCRVLEDACRAS